MEDVSKSAQKVRKELNKMLSTLDNKLASIPSDHSDLIRESRIDITKALNAIKTGETEPLQNILKKYANFNR